MKKILLFIILSLSAFCIICAQEVKILFGGDVTFGDNYHRIANVGNNYGYSFLNLKCLIDNYDYFVVNLETAITDCEVKTPKKFNFKTPKTDLEILKQGGVDAVTLANNHAFDYGKIGLFDTFDALDEYGINYFGAGRSSYSARKAHRVILNGIKVSFLGFANDENINALPFVPHRYKEDIESAIKREKQSSDIVIIFFHFGVEMDKQPRDEEIVLAHKCINAGADVIVGSHPHVVQTIEVYKGKPICYSLGNLIFGGNSRGPKDGMLFGVTVKNSKISYEKIEIRVDPVETRYQPYILSAI